MLRASGFALVVCTALAVPARAQIVRVSVSTAGTEADGASGAPSISATGRWVVFDSAAGNLVVNDGNGVSDVFLRDRDTDADGIFDEAGAVATTRISVNPGGFEQLAPSSDPVITPDGRYVCFVSGGDTLAGFGTFGALQIYRLDRTTGTIVRVSVNDAGVAGDLDSTEPVISDDGNVVAFTSLASTLVPGAATTTTGVFVRDLAAGRTTRITPPGPSSERAFLRPTISADGRFVAYQSTRVVRPFGLVAAAVLDRVTGVERTIDATFPFVAQVSADGTQVLVHALEGLFRLPMELSTSQARSLALQVSGGILAGSPDITRALVSGAPSYVADFALRRSDVLPLVALDGAFSRSDRYLAVVSPTASLVPADGDTNGVADVFVIDLPDHFDADDDGLDDRWEAAFGVGDPAADPDGDGVTTLQEFQAGTHPNGTTRRYFAEGATGTFFQTVIALSNPHPTPASALLTFDTGGGRG